MKKFISSVLAAAVLLGGAAWTGAGADTGDQVEYLINIGENMTFERNRATWNMNWTSGNGTVEYADYTRTMETAAYVSADGSELIVPQTVSSAYQQRLLMGDPNDVTLDRPLTFEVTFRIEAEDYGNAPNVSMFFYGLREVRTPMLELSEDMADKERTLKYVIDPESSVITGYLDGEPFGSAQYEAKDSISGTWGIFVSVQNRGETNLEKSALVSPVTWTYTGFTVTRPASEGTEPSQPTPLPDDDTEYTDPGDDEGDGLVTHKIVDIGSGMKLSGSILSETGAFEFINWTGGSIEYGLSGGVFKTYQTKGSMWGQRLRMSSPEAVSLDSKTVFKLRFKCTADNYNVTLPRAQVMFDSNGVTQYVMRMDNGVNVLSPTKKDVWRTLLYTIDPEAGTIVGTLDGEKVCEAKMNENVDMISQPAFEFAVSETDNGSITTPVTWQAEKIEVYQRRAPEPPAEPLAAPVVSGAWESAEYAGGCGADDSTQLTGTELDLGGKYIINKVAVDQDASDIMSWSIEASSDGINYTRVSDVYAGGVPENSGKHTVRFAPIEARYVRYSCVLIGNHYTKARLNSLRAEYTEPSGLELEGLPEVINPAENGRFALSTRITESGDEYTVSSGVKYSVSGAGASVSGRYLTVESGASGTVTVTAEDLTNGVKAEKMIEIKELPEAVNFRLCADSEYTAPYTGGETVYARAELRACADDAANAVKLMIAAYTADGVLESLTVSERSAADGNEIAASLTPGDGAAYVKAFLWSKDGAPLCGVLSSEPNGVCAQNIEIDKSESAELWINADGAEWVSDSSGVAAVNGSAVTGTGAGTASLTAYSTSDGAAIASVTVKVVPKQYVFLLMGQSNMTGTNNPAAEGYKELPVSDNVMLLNKNNEFEHASHKYSRYSQITWSESYHDYNGGVGLQYGINMGYSFAEDWADENPDKVIGLIVNSQAGCSIDIYERESDDPAANGYENTIERVRAALEGGGELAGILWHQGESNMNNADYHARLRNVLYDFRLAFGDMETPFIAGGLSEDGLGSAQHNLKTARQEDYIAAFGFASSSDPELILSRYSTGCYTGAEADRVHFSAKGQLEFGHRYYNAYKAVLDR